MKNDDVIAARQIREYPWYAAWDLAFTPSRLDRRPRLRQASARAHAARRLPAPQRSASGVQWNFGDVNPPVHAWAALYIYHEEKARSGSGDLRFLRRAFNGLVLNFTWWLNRKDPFGRNVFEGGFLGLDNIGVFDRSKPLPTGGRLEQADGTAWMILYSQNMLEIARALAAHDPVYEDSALRFFEHYMWVAAAMDRIGANKDEMWDGEDGFFYDVLRLPTAARRV